MSDRKYLKDVFPRVFKELQAWANAEGKPTLLHHAEHLFVTGRCDCGRCSNFFVDSDLPELSRAQGSTKAIGPAYHDAPGVFLMLGMTANEDGTFNLVSFEAEGQDYPDGYLNAQLEANGWPRSPFDPDVG